MWTKFGVLILLGLAMADSSPPLANILAGQGASPEDAMAGPYPYGRPRFPNPDPRAYFDAGSQEAFRNEGMGDRMNDLRTTLPLALLGLRPGTASASMRAFNPKAPEAPLPRRPEPAMSDNGWAQHLYENALGRVRGSGDAVAPQGTHPALQWLIAALGAYGGYKGWSHLTGIDLAPTEVWSDWQHMKKTGMPSYADPDHPKFEPAERARWLENNARAQALFDGNREDRALADQLGLDIGFLNRLRSPAAGLSAANTAALDRRRLPGGVGNAPY